MGRKKGLESNSIEYWTSVPSTHWIYFFLNLLQMNMDYHKTIVKTLGYFGNKMPKKQRFQVTKKECELISFEKFCIKKPTCWCEYKWA